MNSLSTKIEAVYILYWHLVCHVLYVLPPPLPLKLPLCARAFWAWAWSYFKVSWCWLKGFTSKVFENCCPTTPLWSHLLYIGEVSFYITRQRNYFLQFVNKPEQDQSTLFLAGWWRSPELTLEASLSSFRFHFYEDWLAFHALET